MKAVAAAAWPVASRGHRLRRAVAARGQYSGAAGSWREGPMPGSFRRSFNRSWKASPVAFGLPVPQGEEQAPGVPHSSSSPADPAVRARARARDIRVIQQALDTGRGASLEYLRRASIFQAGAYSCARPPVFPARRSGNTLDKARRTHLANALVLQQVVQSGVVRPDYVRASIFHRLWIAPVCRGCPWQPAAHGGVIGNMRLDHRCFNRSFKTA